jgi:hypothetical protein
MVDICQDGVFVDCPLSCAVCKACHKRLTEMDECPEPADWQDKYVCIPDCPNYDEIWDEKELQEELDKDEDKHLLDEPSED